MVVEVSYDDVIMEVENNMKIWRDIGRTGGNKGDVNHVMDVDGDMVDDGCNLEMLGGRLNGEEGVGGQVDEDNGVVNSLPPDIVPGQSFGQWCSLSSPNVSNQSVSIIPRDAILSDCYTRFIVVVCPVRTIK